MPKIVELRPKVPMPPLVEQCQASPDVTSTRLTEWRQQRYREMHPGFDPMKCQRHATIKIDGKNYCRPHAGQLALQILLDQQKGKRK